MRCAGRLWKSKYLRKKGEVRYNGHSRREFNMARTIAMVDQIDQHIANLTVRETLEFAHICQVGICPFRQSQMSIVMARRSQKNELKRMCQSATSARRIILRRSSPRLRVH